MAFGDVPQGTANRILVGTAAPPATPVGGLQQWGYPNNRATQDEEFYNDFAPITTAGPIVRRKTMRVKYAKNDSGQEIIKDSMELGTTIFTSALMDGTTGEYIPGITTQWEPAGPSPRQAADIQVTISAIGAAVPVGGGY